MEAFVTTEVEKTTLAIYRAGVRPAVVLEKRRLQLQEKATAVLVLDLPSTLTTAPVHFRSLADPHATAVTSERLEEALAAPAAHTANGTQAELSSYVGWACEVTTAAGERLEGVVGGVEEGRLALLQLARGEEARPRVRRRLLPLQSAARPEATVRSLRLSKPSTLDSDVLHSILQPSLEWTITTPHPGDHPVELLYECTGLTWDASYVINVDLEAGKLELLGRFSLANNSGKSFTEAEIGLVDRAGTALTPFAEEAKAELSNILSKARGHDGPKNRSEPELAYAVPAAACSSLPSGESRCVTFVHAKDVAWQHSLLLSCGVQDAELDQLVFSSKESSATVKTQAVRCITFSNDSAAGLGVHLPAGDVLVRITGAEQEGRATTSVRHSAMLRYAPEELVCIPVQLTAGITAPNVTAVRERRGLRKDTSKQTVTEGVQITVTNNFRAAHVVVEDSLFRYPHWQIATSSPPHVAQGNRRIRWELPRSQIGDKTILRYTAVYYWTTEELVYSDEEQVPADAPAAEAEESTSLGRIFSRFSRKKRQDA